MPAAGFVTTSMYENEGIPTSSDLIVDAGAIDFYLWHNSLFSFYSTTKPGYMSSEKRGVSAVERPIPIISSQTQIGEKRHSTKITYTSDNNVDNSLQAL